MKPLNWLDVIVILVVIFFTIRGVLKGLFREAFGLAGILLGIIVAINRYEAVGQVIARELEKLSTLSPKVVNLISFSIIFIGIALLCSLAGVLLHKVAKYSFIRSLDQAGGFLLGLFEGSLICSIALILLSVSPLADRSSGWMKNSFFSPYLLKEGPAVYDSLLSIVPGKAKKFMEKLDRFEEMMPKKGKKE